MATSGVPAPGGAGGHGRRQRIPAVRCRLGAYVRRRAVVRYRVCMRFFNNAGPCDRERDYMLPPEPRLPGARNLVDRGRYFVVHAPRQTGKTTTLTALARDITADGRQAALLFSCERARIYSKDVNDVGAVGRAILYSITEAARWQELPEDCLPPQWPDA